MAAGQRADDFHLEVLARMVNPDPILLSEPLEEMNSLVKYAVPRVSLFVPTKAAGKRETAPYVDPLRSLLRACQWRKLSELQIVAQPGEARIEVTAECLQWDTFPLNVLTSAVRKHFSLELLRKFFQVAEHKLDCPSIGFGKAGSGYSVQAVHKLSAFFLVQALPRGFVFALISRKQTRFNRGNDALGVR